MYHLDLRAHLNYDVVNMRKAAIAQWILSLAEPPQRASSITGDLMEQAESRGASWFWYSVLRIILALPAVKGVGLWILSKLPLIVLAAVAARTISPIYMLRVLWGLLVFRALTQFFVGHAVAQWAPRREFSTWFTLSILESAINLVTSVGFGSVLFGALYIGKVGRTTMALSVLGASVVLDQLPALLGAVVARFRLRRTAVAAQ
jgi:hypothetical protein